MTRDLSRHRVRNLHTLGDLCTVLVQRVALCAVSKFKCRQNSSKPLETAGPFREIRGPISADLGPNLGRASANLV